MGYRSDKRRYDSIDDVMQKIAERELKEVIQPTSDDFFEEIFVSCANDSVQNTDKIADRTADMEQFIVSQLQIAENSIYFPRKIEKGRSKKAKLVITAEPFLKKIFEESLTKAFDKNLLDGDRKVLVQLFGVYHLLDNLTQTAFENVIAEEQKNFKKQRRKKLEQEHNIYYKEIELTPTVNKK